MYRSIQSDSFDSGNRRLTYVTTYFLDAPERRSGYYIPHRWKSDVVRDGKSLVFITKWRRPVLDEFGRLVLVEIPG